MPDTTLPVRSDLLARREGVVARTEEQDASGAEAAEADELQEGGGDHACDEVAEGEDGVVRRGVGGGDGHTDGHACDLRRGHSGAAGWVSLLINKHPVWQAERDALSGKPRDRLQAWEPLAGTATGARLVTCACSS